LLSYTHMGFLSTYTRIPSLSSFEDWMATLLEESLVPFSDESSCNSLTFGAGVTSQAVLEVNTTNLEIEFIQFKSIINSNSPSGCSSTVTGSSKFWRRFLDGERSESGTNPPTVVVSAQASIDRCRPEYVLSTSFRDSGIAGIREEIVSSLVEKGEPPT
jgi:hypothetical protein